MNFGKLLIYSRLCIFGPNGAIQIRYHYYYLIFIHTQD